MVGEGVLTGAGDGGSHCIQVRKQREEEEQMLAHLASSFPLSSQGPQPMEWVTYTQGGLYLPNSTSLGTPSQTCSNVSPRQFQIQSSWP